MSGVTKEEFVAALNIDKVKFNLDDAWNGGKGNPEESAGGYENSRVNGSQFN